MSERPTGLLRVLRTLTLAARRVPGMVLLLEPLRRHFARRPGSLVIQYDRDLAIEVQLMEHMGSHLFWYGAYSRDILALLDRLLSPGMVVVDVGANIGEISLAAGARVTPGGRVIAFEPADQLADRLRSNVARNRPLSIEIIPAALGATPGNATLFDASEAFRDGSRHGGVVTLFRSERCDTPVGETSVLTLDGFVAQHALDRLDLIKVDVEGAELPVLLGASDTLKRFRPWVILEVQEETCRAAGYRQRDLLDYLTSLGYSFSTIRSRGTLVSLTVERLQPFQNVLCSPPGRT